MNGMNDRMELWRMECMQPNILIGNLIAAASYQARLCVFLCNNNTLGCDEWLILWRTTATTLNFSFIHAISKTKTPIWTLVIRAMKWNGMMMMMMMMLSAAIPTTSGDLRPVGRSLIQTAQPHTNTRTMLCNRIHTQSFCKFPNEL